MTDARPVVPLNLTVNGRPVEARIEPREMLSHVLRERLGLTGTKVSCDAQVCGACTVLVDGRSVSACSFLAADADTREVLTVEGLDEDGRLSVLQQAFIQFGAFQCGFCTPGMLMAATELLSEGGALTREAVIERLDGNICRCTGYETIVRAIMWTAEQQHAELER
jgi:aerobic-type carbon monoxide dehydrogenase small subunit (CoxS/CutS family)